MARNETAKLRGGTVGPCDDCGEFRALEVFVSRDRSRYLRLCGVCRRDYMINATETVTLSEVGEHVLR